jgi:hypothetical protein
MWCFSSDPSLVWPQSYQVEAQHMLSFATTDAVSIIFHAPWAERHNAAKSTGTGWKESTQCHREIKTLSRLGVTFNLRYTVKVTTSPLSPLVVLIIVSWDRPLCSSSRLLRRLSFPWSAQVFSSCLW